MKSNRTFSFFCATGVGRAARDMALSRQYSESLTRQWRGHSPHARAIRHRTHDLRALRYEFSALGTDRPKAIRRETLSAHRAVEGPCRHNCRASWLDGKSREVRGPGRFSDERDGRISVPLSNGTTSGSLRRHILTRAQVDEREHTDPAAVLVHIVRKVHCPARICLRRDRARCSHSGGSLPPPTPLRLQLQALLLQSRCTLLELVGRPSRRSCLNTRREPEARSVVATAGGAPLRRHAPAVTARHPPRLVLTHSTLATRPPDKRSAPTTWPLGNRVNKLF